MKQRSKAYQFTIPGPKKVADNHVHVQNLKAKCILHNLTFPANKYRVVLKGRLGKDNPHAHLYRKGGPRHWAIKSGSVSLEHAGRFDVYVYRKY